MNAHHLSLFLAAALLMGACGGSAATPTAEPGAAPAVATAAPPEPTAVAAATSLPSPEATPTSTTGPASAAATEPGPTATPVPADWADFESVTADGFNVRGNPEAPILILDYSDFL